MSNMTCYNKFLIFFFLTVSNNILLCEGNHEHQKWNDIRAGYMGVSSFGELPKMQDVGLNAALVKFRNLSSNPSKKELLEIQSWANSCQKNNIKFYIVFNLWGPYEKIYIIPGAYYQVEDYIFPDTPCPLNDHFFKLSVYDRLKSLARLSRTVPIEGAVIDLEMYNADITSYHDLCNCRKCKLGRLDDPNQSNLEYAVNNLYSKACFTSQEVLSESPKFKIGFLKLDKMNFFEIGLAKGFSEVNRVYAFSEELYRTGFSDYIENKQRQFRAKKLNVGLVVGIWQSQIPPDFLPEQYYYSSRASSGYWIYSIDEISRRSQSTLPYPRQDYWEAVRTANMELNKSSQNPDHRTNLHIRDFINPLPATSTDITTPHSLRYIYKTEFNSPSMTPPINLRKFNRIVFNAQKGDLISFALILEKKPRNKHTTIEALLSTNMLIYKNVYEGFGAHDFSYVAPENKTYSLTLNCGNNLVRISNPSHFYSIDASKVAHLLKPNIPLYLSARKGVNMGKIGISVDGPGEGINIEILNSSGTLIIKKKILGKEEISVDLKAKEDQIYTLKMVPIHTYEDVFIHILDGFCPFISSLKEGIMCE